MNDNDVHYDEDGDVIEWFVARFPSSDATEGRIMWDLAFDTKAKCEAACVGLRVSFPGEVFTPDCLDEVEEVFQRDVAPVIGTNVAVAKVFAALAIERAQKN